MKKLLLILFLPLALFGQNTTINNLGVINAQQAANGLGFNVDASSAYAWEYAAAQSVGSTYTRADCSWSGGSPSSTVGVEIQNADNSSGGYQFPAGCAYQLSQSIATGQKAVEDADYGPPYQTISTLSPTAAVATGTYNFPVAVSSGASLATLATACFNSQNHPQCAIYQSGGGQITASGKWAYYGALVTAIDSTGLTITLASQTTVALTTSSVLTIQQLMYAPVQTQFGGNWLTDPSVMAYVHYAQYLSNQLGTNGQVALWNEPIWAHDPWNYAASFYDTSTLPYGNAESYGMSILVALAAQTPVPGQTYISDWTNKSASPALFNFGSGAGYAIYTTTQNIQQQIQSEAIHPYSNNPEDLMWSRPCLIAQSLSGGKTPSNAYACNLIGLTSSFLFIQSGYMNQQALGGLSVSITETGFGTGTPGQYQTAQARHSLRQFLGFQAAGVSPIMFYKISNGGTTVAPVSAYDWFDASTHAPYQIATDFMALMADIKSIKTLPISPLSACLVPSVMTYSGTYPLLSMAMMGTLNATDQRASVLYFDWQMSNASSNWYSMASPAAVQVTHTIPAGYNVNKVVDTVTQTNVTYTLNGTSLVYPVADDPIEVFLVPTNTATSSPTCAGNPS